MQTNLLYIHGGRLNVLRPRLGQVGQTEKKNQRKYENITYYRSGRVAENLQEF